MSLIFILMLMQLGNEDGFGLKAARAVWQPRSSLSELCVIARKSDFVCCVLHGFCGWQRYLD